MEQIPGCTSPRGSTLGEACSHNSNLFLKIWTASWSQKESVKKNIKNNYTQSYLPRIVSRMDVDIFGGAETWLQWDLVHKSKSLWHQLELRDGARCCTGHNIHEHFGRCHQDGTFLVATEQVGKYVTTVGADKEGLGRWCWMKLTGQTVTTRIVVAYQQCATRKKAIHATMAQ